jgi:hypothetical protein
MRISEASSVLTANRRRSNGNFLTSKSSNFVPSAQPPRTLEKHSPLLRSLGLARYWQHLQDDGKFRSITEISVAERMDVERVSRILRLAQISPRILKRYLTEGLFDPQQSTSSLWLRSANLYN